MRILDIEVGKISVPLKRPFKTALRTVHSAEDIVIKVTTDTGEVGIGSAAPTAAITGETQESIAYVVERQIKPILVGRDIEEHTLLAETVNGAIARNTSARAAVDMALYDLYCKRFKLPLANLLGLYRTSLTTDVTVSVNDPSEMAADAARAVEEGFVELKIKIGTDAKLDIERVKAVRAAVGATPKIRLDANQGWTAKEAVSTIQKIENLGLDIEFFEQPVKAADIAGMAYVTKHVESPIVADESVFSAQDARRVLEAGAADIINVKLMKAGGIYNAQRIVHLAEGFGVPCMISCMLESKIGITAAACFAASQRNITKFDLDAALLQARDPIRGGVRFERNAIHLPSGAGLGVLEVEGWSRFEA